MVSRDVSIYRADAVRDARPEPIYTVSVDEKPGVQAIGLTAPALPSVPGRHATVGRDYEYVRHGKDRMRVLENGSHFPATHTRRL